MERLPEMMPAFGPAPMTATTPLPRPAAPGPGPELDPARLAAANINPRTRLATDYLNHFNEAIMMLEMLAAMPDCIVDLVEWRPLTYPEHFAAANFKDRDLAIVAYEGAEPAIRSRLDELADAMNLILVSTRDAILTPLSEPVATAVAAEAVARLKPLVAQAGGVINGGGERAVEAGDASQAAIDALMSG
jgi:hypothetical protein